MTVLRDKVRPNQTNARAQHKNKKNGLLESAVSTGCYYANDPSATNATCGSATDTNDADDASATRCVIFCWTDGATG